MFTNPLLRFLLLALIGLSAGSIIAAGVFAFLAIIGVFPRLIGKTKTRSHIMLYETVIVSGGIFGNLWDIYEFPLTQVFSPIAPVLLAIFGVCVGVFVGCLAMSLAETLKALPVISRRIRLSVGLQYLIFSIALGKLAGSLLYFFYGMDG